MLPCRSVASNTVLTSLSPNVRVGAELEDQSGRKQGQIIIAGYGLVSIQGFLVSQKIGDRVRYLVQVALVHPLDERIDIALARDHIISSLDMFDHGVEHAANRGDEITNVIGEIAVIDGKHANIVVDDNEA